MPAAGNQKALGLDFGTTNSALAVVDDGGEPELATFATADGETAAFRSVLYGERDEDTNVLSWKAGPEAIEAYLTADEPGRLIQSLKSFLPSRSFVSTNVLGEVFRLEALIGFMLARLRERAEARFGALEGPLVVGRPVNFAGAKTAEDEEFALSRLRASYWNAGFGEVEFEYEPVAAAYFYEQRLDHDELLLIADFGGGTSDFTIIRVGPKRRREGSNADTILGTAGVGVAGDAFDGRFVRHVVAPALGMGAMHRSMFDRVLQIPDWIYRHLQRWHHLSFLRTTKTLQILHDLRREALEPEKLDALLHLVREDLGFPLYRCVERSKVALSHADETAFEFRDGPVAIEDTVFRTDFMTWIWEEVEEIGTCLDGLLESCNVTPADIDRVFLTGGTSFVPAVRGLFLERFHADRIRSGSELTSVASGLALCAAEKSATGER